MITFDLDLALREATALRTREEIFLLLDENTAQHCLPLVEQTLDILPSHRLCLAAGEENKTLQTITQIWDFLIANRANRHSLLLILGGGMLTDMGGFAASTFMRGMPYVNIPTTLLGIVDASSGAGSKEHSEIHGHKTGFNYQGLKNEIGLFSQPQHVIIYPPFLQSLPSRQLLSGYAEMLKHALIASPLELAQVLAFDWEKIDWEVLTELIRRSIEIKNYIVEQDPEEQGLRKTLNFGHTVGHALEAYSLQHASADSKPLLHGEAVAYGLVAETYLSYMKLGFPEKVVRNVAHYVFENYGRIACPCKDYDVLLDLMRHDKKNEVAACTNDTMPHINFTLLSQVGNYRINQLLTPQEVTEALDFLFNQ